PTRPAPFPYTTLFRSLQRGANLLQLPCFARLLLRGQSRSLRVADSSADTPLKIPHARAVDLVDALAQFLVHGNDVPVQRDLRTVDRKSTRLNSSHVKI